MVKNVETNDTEHKIVYLYPTPSIFFVNFDDDLFTTLVTLRMGFTNIITNTKSPTTPYTIPNTQANREGSNWHVKDSYSFLFPSF